MIEHCRDFRRIKKIMDHDVNISSDCFYLIESINEEDLGFWFFHPYNDELMIHVELNLKCRGKRAIESAHNAFKWIFTNTLCNVIYAEIPIDKKKVRVFAHATGFEFEFCENDFRYYILKRPIIEMKMAV